MLFYDISSSMIGDLLSDVNPQQSVFDQRTENNNNNKKKMNLYIFIKVNKEDQKIENVILRGN